MTKICQQKRINSRKLCHPIKSSCTREHYLRIHLMETILPSILIFIRTNRKQSHQKAAHIYSRWQIIFTEFRMRVFYMENVYRNEKWSFGYNSEWIIMTFKCEIQWNAFYMLWFVSERTFKTSMIIRILTIDSTIVRLKMWRHSPKSVKLYNDQHSITRWFFECCRTFFTYQSEKE